MQSTHAGYWHLLHDARLISSLEIAIVNVVWDLCWDQSETYQFQCMSTSNMLTYSMMKYPLNPVHTSVDISATNDRVCFSILNILPGANKSVRSIITCIQWNKLFYEFWRLKSSVACWRLNISSCHNNPLTHHLLSWFHHSSVSLMTR